MNNNNNNNIEIQEDDKKSKKCPLVVRKNFVALANSVKKSLRDKTLSISDLFQSSNGTFYYQVRIEDKVYFITKEDVLKQLPTTAAADPKKDNFEGHRVKNGCEYTYKGQDDGSYKFTLISGSKIGEMTKVSSSIKHDAQESNRPLQCPKQVYFTASEASSLRYGQTILVDGPKTTYSVKANGIQYQGFSTYALQGDTEIFADLDDDQSGASHVEKKHLVAGENQSYYYDGKKGNTCFYRVTFPSLVGGALSSIGLGTKDFTTWHFGLQVMRTDPVDQTQAHWRKIVKQFRDLVNKTGAANQWSGQGTEVGWLSHFSSDCKWGEKDRGWQLNAVGESIQQNIYDDGGETYKEGKEDILLKLYEALFTVQNPKCVAITSGFVKHVFGQGNYEPGVFSEEDQKSLSILRQAMDNFVKNSKNQDLKRTYETKKKINPESFDNFEPKIENLINHGLIGAVPKSRNNSLILWQNIKNLQLMIRNYGFGNDKGMGYLLPMHDTRTKQFDELTWFLALKNPDDLNDPLRVGRMIKFLHFFARGLGDYHPKVHGTTGWFKGLLETEDETQLILQKAKDLQSQTMTLKDGLISLLPINASQHQSINDLNVLKQQSKNQLNKILREKDEIWILSCDGGGIRGAIGAHLLNALQENMGEKKIVDTFDFFAGTSTGSLIALSFVMPQIGKWQQPKYDTTNLIDLYTRKGGDIFSGKSKASALLGSQYSHLSLERLLRDFYGTVTMSQLLKPTLVTSVGLTRGRPVFFTSYEAANPNKKNKPNAYAWEVARTSSAAPAFFSPMVVTNEKTGIKGVYVDGGPSTNNPSDLAVSEVLKACKNLKQDCRLHRVNVLSIGTGFPPLGKPGQESGLKTGLPGVLNAFVDIGMNFHSDETDRNTIRRLKKWISEKRDSGFTFSYYRFNPDLHKKVELDGISPEEQKQLEDLGLSLTETPEFKQLVDHLNNGDPSGQYAWKKEQEKNIKEGIYRVGHQLKGLEQPSYDDDSESLESERSSPILMKHKKKQKMHNQDVIDDQEYKHSSSSKTKEKK